MIAEWPLVVFTVASELASGLALAAAVLDLRPRDASREAGRPAGMLVFPVAALGMAASIFHLGRPFSAWRAVLNWRTSPLSTEILFYGLFLGAALVTSGLWTLRRPRGRRAVGALTAAFGLAAVVTSSLVYLLPGRAPWDSIWVPLSFLGSAIVLGGTAAFARSGSEAFPRRASLAATGAGGLAIVVSAALMVVRFSGAGPDAYASVQLAAARDIVLSGHFALLGVQVLFAGLLPAVTAGFKWRSPRPFSLGPRAVFWAALVGVVAGRVLMFAAGSRIPIF
jgi:anaerobic dimethyl sulfoxide reductase subunit C (anchor subunit)